METAVAALRDPAAHHYGTVQGGPALRALVATAIADDTGLSWSADDVQIALGVKHALVVPGEAFNVPGRICVCFAVDDDTLITALERLHTALGPTRHESAAPQLEEAR
ncbi:hypothetical protein ACH4TX_45205 [Streptomyces sp. NPDC021098]|uniref:hypothetical protein n=1 Tax=unclassified Streptomyces TaxID=2593676 RepID=UPI0037BD6905